MRTRLNMAMCAGSALALAVAAMAFAAPSASAWDPADEYHAVGELETHLLLPTGVSTLHCDVEVEADLFAGSHNHGRVETVNPTNCMSTISEDCEVDVVANDLDWPLRGYNEGDGSGPVHVALVNFTFEYEDPACPVEGLVYTVEGGVVGDYNAGNGTFEFPASEELDVLWVTASNSMPAVPHETFAEFEGEMQIEETAPELED